jgi:lysophospholipase L1-like esterase
MLSKVLILADSLALPREGADDIPYESTYPYLLEERLRRHYRVPPIILERGMRRRTIEYVLDEWFELVELRTPDLIIIHVGIVDCAPRIFLRRERQFVEGLRWRRLRESILKFVHQHRAWIIRTRRRVYVPLDRFRPLVQNVVDKARQQKTPVVFVNIIEPADEIEKRSPGFQENVRLYNQVLAGHADGQHVLLVDLNSIVIEHGSAQMLTADGIHIDRQGHELLAGELEKIIHQFLKPQTESAELATPAGGTLWETA